VFAVLPVLPPRTISALTAKVYFVDDPRGDPDDLTRQIERQLPVISRQQDSLAAVMLVRWLRLVGDQGTAGLEVQRRRRRERWAVRWQTPDRRAHALEAPTLAELFVRLLAALPEADRRRLEGPDRSAQRDPGA
jgi:hypothetical protein